MAWVAAAAGFGRGVAGAAARQVPGLMRGLGRYARTSTHARGTRWVLENYGLARKMSPLGRALGLGFLGIEAYMGYQKEGWWGAAKGVATGAAWSYGLGVVLGSAALPLTMGAAAIGGSLVLNKMAAEGGLRYAKRHARADFGGGVRDQFGNVSTMRRRSIQALQQSRLNGAMTLGREALQQYQPYFR